MAVGVASLAFGCGIVVLTSVFSSFLATTSVPYAILRASCLLAGGMVPAVMCIRWPEEANFERVTANHSPVSGCEAAAEETPILGGTSSFSSESRGYWCIIKTRNFWLYVTVIFTTGASFCLNPYFYKIGLLYGAQFSTLVFWYNVVNVISTLAGLAAGALLDSKRLRTRSGYWSSAARNVILAMTMLQALMFLTLVRANDARDFATFIAARCVLSVIVTVHFTAAVILARDIFGEADGSRAFGIGAGVSIGSGDSASVALMALALRITAHGRPSAASDFDFFNWLAVVWSLVGVLCAALIEVRA